MELLTKIYEGITYTEEWRPIKGYEGMYEVSSFGRVRSLDRVIYRVDGKVKKFKGQLLKPQLNNGYEKYSLSINSKLKNSKSHLLVALAFFNHTPSGYSIVVDHKDNDRLNNFFKNLQIITQRENLSKEKVNYNLGLTGVKMRKDRKFEASIKINNKNKYLGSFNTSEEASKYYKNALKAIEKGEDVIVKRRNTSSLHKGGSFLQN